MHLDAQRILGQRGRAVLKGRGEEAPPGKWLLIFRRCPPLRIAFFSKKKKERITFTFATSERSFVENSTALLAFRRVCPSRITSEFHSDLLSNHRHSQTEFETRLKTALLLPLIPFERFSIEPVNSKGGRGEIH